VNLFADISSSLLPKLPSKASTNLGAIQSDLVYLLCAADGTKRVVHDRMVLGISPRETWTRRLTDAGFQQVVSTEQSGRDIFRGVIGST
jgi:hypothetical protein